VVCIWLLLSGLELGFVGFGDDFTRRIVQFLENAFGVTEGKAIGDAISILPN